MEKATNGFDADLVTDPQAQLAVGDPVEWTYVVANTGQTALTLIDLIDDSGTPAPTIGDDSDILANFTQAESLAANGGGIVVFSAGSPGPFVLQPNDRMVITSLRHRHPGGAVRQHRLRAGDWRQRGL